MEYAPPPPGPFLATPAVANATGAATRDGGLGFARRLVTRHANHTATTATLDPATRETNGAALLSTLNADQVLRRLELLVLRRLEGYLRGEHLGMVLGPGTEHAEARLYRPGVDDVRHMDWAVTARTTTPHVREVIADRELETWALVDRSPSMAFGTTGLDKAYLAAAAVVTVAVIAQRGGDRFGAVCANHDSPQWWPARSGKTALAGLLKTLLTPLSEVDREPRRHGEPSPLGRALDQLGRSVPRRGLRVVVSDFLEPEHLWANALRRLSLRHQVLAVQVVDPREMQVPNVGTVVVVDPETGETFDMDTAHQGFRQRFEELAAQRQHALDNVIRRTGASHLVLRTDSDWVRDTALFVMNQRRAATSGATLRGVG